MFWNPLLVFNNRNREKSLESLLCQFSYHQGYIMIAQACLEIIGFSDSFWFACEN